MPDFMSLLPTPQEQQQQAPLAPQQNQEAAPGEFQENAMQEAQLPSQPSSAKKPQKPYDGSYNQTYSEVPPVSQRQFDENGSTITLTPEELENEEGQSEGPMSSLNAETKPIRASQSFTGNQDRDASLAQNMFDNANYSQSQSKMNQPKYDDPTTWSPSYTDMAWTEQWTRNMGQGVGTAISGVGNALQYAPFLTGLGRKMDPELDGTMVSRLFQSIGENVQNADMFKNYIPKGLEEVEWSDLLDKRLYSTHLAKMLPDAILMIMASSGIGSLASKGTGAAVKQLAKGSTTYGKGATKMAAGAEVFGSGGSIVGRFATTEGLTAMGNGLIHGVAGGAGMNVLVGLRNSADLINTQREIEDPATGKRMFTDDDLAEMGLNAFKTNLYYIGVDMASFGMTFGGGWKAAAKLNPLRKGAPLRNALEQSKMTSSMFAYQTRPFMNGIARVTGKAIPEAIEEQFQESWEEWAVKKAIAEKTGEKEYDNFMEFFFSDENKTTRVLSAAMGGIVGGGANISSAINKQAEDNYRLYDQTKNLKEIIEKNGTKAELEFQQYAIDDHLGRIIADGQEQLLPGFIDKLLENGNITAEEKADMLETVKELKKIQEKAVRLNVTGKRALIYNKQLEYTTEKRLKKNREDALLKIKDIESDVDLTENQKKEKIRQISEEYEMQVSAKSEIIAKARQNQANLIIGKRAELLKAELGFDKYGNPIVRAGLTEEEYDKLTIEGEKAMEGQRPKKYYDNKDFNEKEKSIFKSIKEKFGLDKMNKVFDKFKKKPTESETEAQQTQTETQEQAEAKAAKKTEQNAPNEVDFEVDEDGNAKPPEPKTPEQAEAETKAAEEVKPSNSPNETIGDVEMKTILEDGPSQERINSIADKIAKGEELTDREATLATTYKTAIKKQIARKEIGTTKAFENKSNPIDDLSAKNISQVESDNAVKIKRNDDGTYDILTEKGNLIRSQKRIDAVERQIQDIIDNNIKVEKDAELTEEENEFIAEEATKDTAKGKNLSQQQKADRAKAEKEFKIKADLDNSVEDSGLMDSREGDIGIAIQLMNLKESQFKSEFISKMLEKKYTGNVDQFSENELDNYINTNSLKNLQGPNQLSKMAVLNHSLKNMFPNTTTPAQVVVVKNLYDAIGSQGLASVVGMTMFVDEKALDTTSAYMHEMSHIFFRLAQTEPEVKEMIKSVILDKALIKEIKAKYGDYVLYDVVLDNQGRTKRMTKGQIEKQLKRSLTKDFTIDDAILSFIEQGDIKLVPLSKQRLIIEEAFVSRLEKPLYRIYDNTFHRRNEERREKDKNVFWGLLKKKGKLISEDDAVLKQLNRIFDGQITKQTDLKGFFLETFKGVTKGVQLDSYALDSRAADTQNMFADKIADIATKKQAQYKSNPEGSLKSVIDKISNREKQEDDFLDAYSEELEENGEPFYNKEYDSQVKTTTKIMQRFGNIYNKVARTKDAIRLKTQGIRKTTPLFNQEEFEAFVFKLAKENPNSNEFIAHIENSALQEVQQFNKYLDKVFPDQKYILLTSMHNILGNAKHVTGVRSVIDSNNVHKMENSLSQKELTDVNNALSKLNDLRETKNSPMYAQFREAVQNIYNTPNPSESDILTVLKTITPYNFKLTEILNDGYITFRGRNIPIETLVTGFIRSKIPFNKDKNGKLKNLEPYVYGYRPLIEALVNTERKHSFFSVVKNAENNNEPVRITNNLLTNELDGMVEDMRAKEDGTKMSKTEFLEKYSHNDTKEGTYTRPNQLLEHIYDNFQKGILPSIVQYHGLEDISNADGNTFQKSTSLEQGLEDFAMFLQTALQTKGGKNSDYLGAMIAFSDSPRKFYMNMKRIDYSEVFDPATRNFIQDGKMMNSLFDLHEKIYGTSGEYKTKKAFKQGIRKSINETIDFMNQNGEQLMALQLSKADIKNKFDMGQFFNSDTKKLNKKGEELVAEYTVNTIANGYYMADVFAPGVKPKDIIKRFKANLSPVFSIKNPNLKIEPIFFADRIDPNGGIASTDSGMYILEEQAKILQKMGLGVFEMNDGFKILNSSIEKDNPNFNGKDQGKLAYLKGYTTIVGPGHPLYNLMKSRLEKYRQNYRDNNNGKEPSEDFSDGTHNNIVIAVPQSSDKGDFLKDKFLNKNEDAYTELGAKMTEEYLSENIDEANAYFDNLYYKDNQFMGISAYNFGPQQLMDKQTLESNTPVQLVNAVITNARLNKNFGVANKIQSLIAKQKLTNLYNTVKSLEANNPEQYKKFINKGLNKEAMDQAQRILFDAGGSVANPYLVEITTNQLSKTLRNAGNKLKTKGTYAHQKPDTDWIYKYNNKQPLKAYLKNADGSLVPAEMIAPSKFADQSFAREKFTFSSPQGKTVIKSSNQGTFTQKQLEEYKKAAEQDRQTAELFVLSHAAKLWAVEKHNVPIETIEKNLKKYIGEERDTTGKLIGYHTKGETVMATRVPSHGPSMTGVYEIIGYNDTKGNQVSVAGEMNTIMGSDNDGDALFIQQKDPKLVSWSEAFDLMTDYWLSPEMADQVTAVIDVKKEIEPIIEKIGKKFNLSEDKNFPFSPMKRQEDYNNTMVSKRNVGPIFNMHKVTNLLAAYEINLRIPLNIDGSNITKFFDLEKGVKSRNMQSALLANTILDNAKYFYADKLGINEHTINESALLINLGLNFEQLGMILNSPVAKLYSEFRRGNNSLYHEGMSNKELFKRVEKVLMRANYLMNADKTTQNKNLQDYVFVAKKQLDNSGYASQKLPSKRQPSYKIDTAKTELFEQQLNILDTFNYLNELTSEVQTISGIMSGHNKVHVNPLVLNEQLNKLDEVLSNTNENQILQITDEFKSNADIQNYRETAQIIFNQVKNINPAYHVSTNQMLESLKNKIDKNLSIYHIENITKDILLFQAARLLGHNNFDKKYVEGLLNQDKNAQDSIYKKIETYLAALDSEIISDPKKIEIKTNRNKSILFSRALNINVDPNSAKKYISASSKMMNEGLSPMERQLVQEEFQALPQELKTGLMVYDLINHGFKGKQSIMPFLDQSLISRIDSMSDKNMGTKNNPISQNAINQLERAIVLKQAQQKSNPLQKVYVGLNEQIIESIASDFDVINKFTGQVTKGESMGIYLNVIKNSPKGKIKSLYEVIPMTEQQKLQRNALRSIDAKNAYMKNVALPNNIKLIENDLSKINNNISIALIPDNTTGSPIQAPESKITKDADFFDGNNLVYNQMLSQLKKSNEGIGGMDARENFYTETYTRKAPLTLEEFAIANEFNPLLDRGRVKELHEVYKVNKAKANQEVANGVLDKVQKADLNSLFDMYKKYGELDVYAYANILTPITLRIAEIKMSEQMKLHKDIKFDGKDVSAIQAYMMSGSTIPSNHPASQALARELEKQYKIFTEEKKKYIGKLNEVTDALYKDRLGYGSEVGLFKGIQPLRNLWNKIKNAFKGINPYERLYGNLVTRTEYINDYGTAVVDYKLKPVEEIEAMYKRNLISEAEKNFYDTFREIGNELKPKNLRKEEKNYIPHTAMSKMELFTSKGLLGLLANSRGENQALYDVQMMHDGVLKNWKQIEDHYKMLAGQSRNDLEKIVEFRRLKSKAKNLLKKGTNEDGSPIFVSTPITETALGFGAINRFANNRSVKATEIPSMDLNKAMADYIHSTLFVNGNENFQGMEKLQGHIDGVLAWNSANNLPQMNKHIQIVWKDYFLRNKRQTSVLGEKADRVILGLTRMNLFYALGWSANANTGGLYALGNVLAGKYHNIKNQGGRKWIQGELRFWGLDKGFKGGITGVIDRMKRNQRIMKSLNFMEINVYDEVNIEKKNGIDRVFTDLALMPMIASEKWIQQVHMLGMLSESDLAKFDDKGNYINENDKVDNETLIRLEDEVKASHGRGYQPTDQRGAQMYSYGTMMFQFARFIPTLMHDRFAKKDVNIYGQETIGSLRAVADMVKYVVNNPADFVRYRNSLNPEMRSRLDQGLKGMAMTAVIAMVAGGTEYGNDLIMDTSYYFNYEKLAGKLVPPAIQSGTRLMGNIF